MSSEAFLRGYSHVATQAAANQLAAVASQEYVGQVQSALDAMLEAIEGGTANAKGPLFAKGDAAEFWHAGSYNVDAARLSVDSSAFAPRNASATDIAYGEGMHEAQLKFYGSPDATLRALLPPEYEAMVKVAPSDQAQAIREILVERAARIQEYAPQAAEDLLKVADTVRDRIQADGASSRPLSELESRQLVDDVRDDGRLDPERWGLTAEQTIQLSDLAREALKAGAQAAALSAAMQLGAIVLSAVQQAIRDGQLDRDALADMVKQAPRVVARSALSGTITAALVTATQSGMLGSAATAVPPTVIAGAVVLSLNALQLSMQASQGSISWHEAGHRIAQDGLALTAAMLGGVAGQALIPVPLLGAIIGNIVGAMLGQVAINQATGMLMGLAVERGWTYFGIVTQDYSVPEEVLRQAGWDTLDLDLLEADLIEVDAPALDELLLDPLTVDDCPFHIMQRGVIGIGSVGYV
ncbi:MAG: hypothetical protein WCA82_01315 [Jiangellales bacterium]